MTISAINVHFDEHTMSVDLTDGRTLRVPLAWFPRLLQATPTERKQVELSRNGLHWEALDEDISVGGLLAGRGDITRQTDPETKSVHKLHDVVSSKVRQSAAKQSVSAGRNRDMEVFVERRPNGDYAVRRANSDRASAVLPTQAKAIERARELNPGTNPHVERIRNTSRRSPDKWRKP
jgi:Protein of unknown function (DUF2442)/Uncharacterized protein conserved in bacteria (DUF2188)